VFDGLEKANIYPRANAATFAGFLDEIAT